MKEINIPGLDNFFVAFEIVLQSAQNVLSNRSRKDPRFLRSVGDLTSYSTSSFCRKQLTQNDI